MQQSHDISFNVEFTHRLRFTKDLFGRQEDVLLNVMSSSGENAPRIQFWIDADVAAANPELKRRIQNFCKRHADKVSCTGNLQIVPGGEAVKNDIHIVERMLKCINHADLDRRSFIVVIGGGAVLDAVGFAAGIAHRGIRLIRIPTTTLAQADSGLGVKNSINLFRKKNWVGTFAVPWAVINDRQLMGTLSDRDFRCGFSEAVKVSLLKDRTLFHRICDSTTAIRNRDEAAWEIIAASAEWHLRHITSGGDAFEMREARPLDFGHWSAHKLEAMTDFEMRHGEAVAIGVAIDSVYSTLALQLPEAASNKVLECLRDLKLLAPHAALQQSEVLYQGLEEFRQHLGGRLTVTMLNDVAQPVDVHEIDRQLMQRAIDTVVSRATVQSRVHDP